MRTQIVITVAILCVTCVLCQESTVAECDPPCKAGTETCVRLSRCKGKKCNMCAETPSIQPAKPTGIQLPGIGGLQKQQLQMLLQAKMLQQQQGKATAATDTVFTETVTQPPVDWTAMFSGNAANTGNTGSNSFTVNDYFLSGYLFDGFGMGFMA
ncbi:uncharacterized protein LOC133192983 [Saccostrea echinata]|uniref:uncharacterized protein LOC133192983 n=1 Tax=Saccostrea echinata TaxID=191078 RepID=UPI002A820EBA|nr:uncharacterized protein LOC133192983 [Saccostrea echinata]